MRSRKPSLSIPGCLAIFFAAAIFSPVHAEPRTWTDATGNFTIQAEFAGIIAGELRLRKADGSTISVPLDRLSDADREWIKSGSYKTQPKDEPKASAQEPRKETPDKSAKEVESEQEPNLSDIKVFHLFDVPGGELAVGLPTPMVYFSENTNRWIGVSLLHAYRDVAGIQDGSRGYYRVQGKNHKLQISERPNKNVGDLSAFEVSLGDHKFFVPVLVRWISFDVGDPVERVLNTIGEPDHKVILSIGRQLWAFDSHPFLRVVVENGQVVVVTTGPNLGAKGLAKWMLHHGYGETSEDDQ